MSPVFRPRPAPAVPAASCSTRRPGTATRSSGCCRTGSWGCTPRRPARSTPGWPGWRKRAWSPTTRSTARRSTGSPTRAGREDLAAAGRPGRARGGDHRVGRDIAREVTEDVRDTVRNLREELTWAAREVRDGKEPAREAAREQARPGPRAGSATAPGGPATSCTAESRHQQAGGRERWLVRGPAGAGGGDQAGASNARPGPGPARPGQGDWPGLQDWPSWTGCGRRAGWRGWADPAGARLGARGKPPGGRLDARPGPGPERTALDFARELRASGLGIPRPSVSDAVSSCAVILEETLGQDQG